MVAGLLVFAGTAGWPLAYALLVVADLVGDTLYYVAGRLGRRPSLGRHLRSLGLTETRRARFATALERHEWRVLVGAKLTHFAGGPALVAAGFGEVSYGRFLGWNLVASLPKTAFFMALGFFSGEHIGVVAGYLKAGSNLFLAVAALAASGLLAWFALRKVRSRRACTREPAPEPPETTEAARRATSPASPASPHETKEQR